MPKPIIKTLSFKPIETKKKVRSSYKPHKLSKLIYAVCSRNSNGEYRANIITVSDIRRNIINLPFSLDSYNLKGKEKVFSKSIDPQTKKHICYIRTPREAKLSGSKSRTVTPFCEDWVYSGYLVRIGKQNYFDIKEAIWHKDFVKENLEVPVEEIRER